MGFNLQRRHRGARVGDDSSEVWNRVELFWSRPLYPRRISDADATVSATWLTPSVRILHQDGRLTAKRREGNQNVKSFPSVRWQNPRRDRVPRKLISESRAVAKKPLGTDPDDLTGLDEFQMIEASWRWRMSASETLASVEEFATQFVYPPAAEGRSHRAPCALCDGTE